MKKPTEPSPESNAMDNVDRAFVLGASFLLLILISGCCFFGRGASDRDNVRACAESCGPPGMHSYNWRDGCVCRAP